MAQESLEELIKVKNDEHLMLAHHVFLFLEIHWPKSPSTIALGVAKKATRILGLHGKLHGYTPKCKYTSSDACSNMYEWQH